MEMSSEIQKYRKIDHSIHPLIYNRWSPRAMTGEEISEEDLMSLFEAARWAPSSYNEQPWRFLYAKRNTPQWDLFFDLMSDFNKSWTKNAAVLVVVVSHTTFVRNGKPSQTHSYDTGASWMSLALEGNACNLVVHGMQGFDYEKAKLNLKIPDGYQVEAMIAIGKRAPKETLTEDLKEMEVPSSRKPLNELISEGYFKF